MNCTVAVHLFWRHPGNAIVTSPDMPYLCNSVFNPAAGRYEDGVVLLVRPEDRRGISSVHVARSADGSPTGAGTRHRC